ncbi:hypothetical protein GALMADRAFT_268571 [Galerina marginata CBS 339.88]|uniref:Uncharacterized protein n=1 Tax=Galerina marginata (strain CBS 339.88) TaxID=685588 RepID=A0A067SVT1_GALM3|nr:hypothetical protein GALMADRAFT_268571 [Galerina marginata CBS 339.88]
MSGQEQGVFAHIQLRSSTPAPNEKVLSFLEGMAREGDEPDNSPPRSMADPDEYRKPESIHNGRHTPQIYSPAPRSKASDTLINPGAGIYSPRNGVKAINHVEEVDNEDADSNIQEGIRSELGEPQHEPGPNDPPGPKYASYDSGPSFGNFGPLPTDERPASNNPYARGSWNPVWADIVNGGGQNGDHDGWNHGANGNATALTEGGLSAYPAGLTSGQQPLNVASSDNGGTPRQTSVNIDIHPPSRGTPSKSSERDVTSSPKPRAPSRAATDQRPWSPLSGRSKLTRATGTAYPPLPESRMGDVDSQYDGPSSPTSKSRARSKAPSISPSDSPSQRVQLFASKQPYVNGTRSPPPASVLSAGGAGPSGHQSRPFSPYRHAPTQEDLLNAAVRGRALVIPQEPEKEPSIASSKSPSKIASPQSRALSQMEGGRPPSSVGSRQSRSSRAERERDTTPTPTRPHSPDGQLDPEETRIVNEALARTPRTSSYGAPLEPDVADHYHDMELCVLLHQENDPNQHDFVKKALRKAVRQRIKKLGMKYDHDSIKQYRKSYHDHDPNVHLRPDNTFEEPPPWATDLKRELVLMQQRIESLGPKIEGLKATDRSFNAGGSRFAYEPDESTRTPMTQTVNIQTQPTGTMADSMYQPPETEMLLDDDGNVREFDEMTETQTPRHHTDGEARSLPRSLYGLSENGRDDSPGQQYLEEELYKLRQKPQGSQISHKSWEVAQHDDRDDEFDENEHGPASGLPTIPDTNGDAYHDDRSNSPPLPDLPPEAKQEMAVHPQGPWNAVDYSTESQQLPPWQRIHARLLNWAIIWPASELEHALNSTTRGQQVDEVALSIWSTQAYKRYVRARLTDSPQGVVDRLFVPPNMADAISNAVFNGRHGDACGMLKDLWAPFGLEGMPRLIVVLAKHRSDPNHWVVHRFSLPDGALTTYDSYPERTLPDGRPLGWWFAIRVAWPNTMYPSPDHLVQKMVRLHRPLQLPIDNSVAAAGIWRNVLMGSRAERSVDLERLRDLINTEVKNLKQRKQLGKLSIGGPRPAWEDMS